MQCLYEASSDEVYVYGKAPGKEYTDIPWLLDIGPLYKPHFRII